MEEQTVHEILLEKHGEAFGKWKKRQVEKRQGKRQEESKEPQVFNGKWAAVLGRVQPV
jgi:hypothetical protein